MNSIVLQSVRLIKGQSVAHFCRVLDRVIAEPLNGKYLQSIRFFGRANE